MGFRSWLERRRREKAVQRLLVAMFESPELLRGTSLKPRHASRAVVVDHRETDGDILCIRFGILRHPRPHPFSRQSHNVIEYWRYDVRARSLRVEKGVNLTRLDGKDASR